MKQFCEDIDELEEDDWKLFTQLRNDGDLLTEAMMDATNKANTQMEAKMKSITGGISIPGLF